MTAQRELTKLWKWLGGDRNRLTALANRYGSDKGNRRFDRHHYTRVYDALFRPLRDQPITLLEIGLLNSRIYSAWTRRGERYAGTAAGSRAPSLEMWADYFPRARIVGFDINDFSRAKLPARCTVLRGDMGSREDLARAAQLGPFDIIIDDASHASHHQQIALGFLFPHVKPGGLYIVEDLQWQPPIEIAGTRKTRDILRQAAAAGDFASDLLLPAERTALATGAASIDFYDSLGPDALNSADALAVIRKRQAVAAAI